MPQRIQRKRTKGWRMPEGAIYVGRPSKWGNPFDAPNPAIAVIAYRKWVTWEAATFWPTLELQGLRWMGQSSNHLRADMPSLLPELRGRDLACWCPLDSPCHADVLLELANDPPSNGAVNV
ncbi:DUF4326 domain-containing protein [Mycobacteroides abscessus]|uniref:DUF4326 domain-containing protein n=1 Tax=Mycobacteroides abscessus TaxID=36809 RepID=UPI000927CED1|nr:DUF4326 domain-containing protein [Mycobacteroides abscessus]MBN7552964.1 DUF4326 domain-containing protein [Mycobacteroides abscessus subsp. abscessus]MDO3044162.1 DUF4326 domain-containing protein [Mycobacteroides abscessus subsp. abscessus]MDO3135622.1 DUF4326 domain-containing protein [Mycobacteroides abscessus subsp. abscessus]MDO3151086.1 DUF4326 domain-containing protein [Mycobacteroides abscessus subsp. abscessus]OTR22557.1 hypothetical protein B9M80_09645 [Mycobacteroides abscessus